MTDSTAYVKGIRGEQLAADFLTSKGMVLLLQRYHSPFGEIDLVMEQNGVLVFVEVKYRPKSGARSGESAVTRRKQQRIVKTARCFLSEYPWPGAVRFDVVEITQDGVLHLPDAFQGREWD